MPDARVPVRDPKAVAQLLVACDRWRERVAFAESLPPKWSHVRVPLLLVANARLTEETADV